MTEAVQIDAGEAPQRTGERLLVPRTRRPVPIFRLLAVLATGVPYAVLAATHPIIGASPASVLILLLLSMLTLGYALASPNADMLDPMRVVSFYFWISFCVAPLAMQELSWHYVGSFPRILPAASAFCLAAYVMTVIGYHLPFFGSVPASIPERRRGLDRTRATLFALALFALGVASWITAFMLAGGITGLVYGGQARGEFFAGFGQYFWGALFMFPGATLYWSTRCVGKSRPPWIHAIPLAIAFVLFLIFQGRMRALNFLIMGIFVSHYLIRPIRARRLAIFGIGGLLLSLFVGVARAPSTRGNAFEAPVALLFEIAHNFDAFARAMITSDFSRLRQIVLIMDKVPSWMPLDWGGSLLAFLNPVLRLLGATEIETIGPRLFGLAYPHAAGLLSAGLLPSVVGEMLVNFPWPIACLCFVPYGVGLRWIYVRLIARRGDFIAVTAYSILLLQAGNVVLQSLGHVVFEMIVILVPLWGIRQLSRRPSIPQPIS